MDGIKRKDIDRYTFDCAVGQLTYDLQHPDIAKVTSAHRLEILRLMLNFAIKHCKKAEAEKIKRDKEFDFSSPKEFLD